MRRKDFSTLALSDIRFNTSSRNVNKPAPPVALINTAPTVVDFDCNRRNDEHSNTCIEKETQEELLPFDKDLMIVLHKTFGPDPTLQKRFSLFESLITNNIQTWNDFRALETDAILKLQFSHGGSHYNLSRTWKAKLLVLQHFASYHKIKGNDIPNSLLYSYEKFCYFWQNGTTEDFWTV
mmetsp:Transcript_28197/g.59082  ORF Transcript_28197/g.59082 Transcript_28197/m.59082 type:complete len:180 (-) Transcript_28197:18-557(-)